MLEVKMDAVNRARGVGPRRGHPTILAVLGCLVSVLGCFGGSCCKQVNKEECFTPDVEDTRPPKARGRSGFWERLPRRSRRSKVLVKGLGLKAQDGSRDKPGQNNTPATMGRQTFLPQLEEGQETGDLATNTEDPQHIHPQLEEASEAGPCNRETEPIFSPLEEGEEARSPAHGDNKPDLSRLGEEASTPSSACGDPENVQSRLGECYAEGGAAIIHPEQDLTQLGEEASTPESASGEPENFPSLLGACDAEGGPEIDHPEHDLTWLGEEVSTPDPPSGKPRHSLSCPGEDEHEDGLAGGFTEERANRDKADDEVRKSIVQINKIKADLNLARSHAKNEELARNRIQRQNEFLVKALQEMESTVQSKYKVTITNLKARMSDLEEKLHKETTEHQATRRQLRQAERKIKGLQLQVDLEQRNARWCLEKADKASTRLKQLAQQLEEAEEETQRTKASHRHLQRELDNIREKEEALNKEVSSLKTKLRQKDNGTGSTCTRPRTASECGQDTFK